MTSDCAPSPRTTSPPPTETGTEPAPHVRPSTSTTWSSPTCAWSPATEPRQRGEDDTRVPTADELATSTARARRTLHEIDAREAYDRQAAEDERAAQLAHCYTDDHTDHEENTRATDVDDTAAYQRTR